ncbi:hypothetical protein ABMA08_25945 [Pseudomonas yamanorum]
MRSIVKAVNLNKYYDQYHALQDINLEVEQGEVLCIIGPSGSGKKYPAALRQSAGKNRQGRPVGRRRTGGLPGRRQQAA